MLPVDAAPQAPLQPMSELPTCDSLELWPQELEEVIHNLYHLNQVGADVCHVIGAGEQQLLRELPASIASGHLDLLTHLRCGV